MIKAYANSKGFHYLDYFSAMDDGKAGIKEQLTLEFNIQQIIISYSPVQDQTPRKMTLPIIQWTNIYWIFTLLLSTQMALLVNLKNFHSQLILKNFMKEVRLYQLMVKPYFSLKWILPIEMKRKFMVVEN